MDLYHINLAKLDYGSKSSLPQWFPVRLGQGHVYAIFTSWKRSSAICSEGQCSTLLIICWLALLAHARCPPSAPPSARPAVCAVHGRVPTSSVTHVVELGGCETPARFHFVFTPSYFIHIQCSYPDCRPPTLLPPPHSNLGPPLEAAASRPHQHQLLQLQKV